MSENNKNKKYNGWIITAISLLLLILLISLPNFQTESQKPEKPSLEILKEEKEKIEKERKLLEVESKIKDLELEKEKIKNPEVKKVSIVEPVKVLAMESHPNLETRKAKINQYFAKYTPTTPLTADMIVKYSNKYQIPDGFFLAVCHNESHCGTKGRAVPTKNPFNVGNITAGDAIATNCQQYSRCLASFENGVEIFAKLISEKYFNENEEIKLETWINRDFRAVRGDVKGGRYMTDTGAFSKYQNRIKNLQELQILY
jgi:hypothetical protein